MRFAFLAVLAAAALAGCSGAPGKSVHVQDVMLYAPAAVTSGEAALQVCVVPARRYAALENAPSGKTMLIV